MSTVEATLAERKNTHGEYLDHADITQRLKDVIRSGRSYEQCSPHERETLDMIAHKVGRIVSGNPHFTDHWHDIAGYATLSEQRNEKPAPVAGDAAMQATHVTSDKPVRELGPPRAFFTRYGNRYSFDETVPTDAVHAFLAVVNDKAGSLFKAVKITGLTAMYDDDKNVYWITTGKSATA